MAKDKVKPSETTRVVSERALRELLKMNRSAKADIDEISTQLSTAVREAAEKKHLHLGAWRTIKGLDRLEPEKLADWWDHFQHMWEVSGLRERAESAPRMDLDKPEPTELEADEAEQQKAAARGNVHHLQ